MALEGSSSLKRTKLQFTAIGALVMKLPINRGGGCHDHRVGMYGQDLTGKIKLLTINRGGGCHDHRVGMYGQDLTGKIKLLSNPF